MRWMRITLIQKQVASWDAGKKKYDDFEVIYELLLQLTNKFPKFELLAFVIQI